MESQKWYIMSKPAWDADATPEQVRGPFKHAETAHAVRGEMDNNDKMHDQVFSVVCIGGDMDPADAETIRAAVDFGRTAEQHLRQ